ncbi:MAG: SMI1/KNR4 family protein [Blastocatellia bacterium]
MRFPLPEQYLHFVKVCGVVECFTSDEPGYIQFWQTDELDKINADYETEYNAPGFIGFASDGGGEMIALDQTGAVFKLPFTGMEPQYAIRIAYSFDELVKRFEATSDGK